MFPAPMVKFGVGSRVKNYFKYIPTRSAVSLSVISRVPLQRVDRGVMIDVKNLRT